MKPTREVGYRYKPPGPGGPGEEPGDRLCCVCFAFLGSRCHYLSIVQINFSTPNRSHTATKESVLCLWFRASLICNCPTKCNTKQSICYSASSLYMFRVSTTPIISTQNCNYSLRYWLYFLCNLATLEGGNMASTGGCSYSFVYS